MTEFSPEELSEYAKYARLLGPLLGRLRKLFPLTNSRDLPVCNTRILRERRGLPWNHQVAVHPTAEGVINIKAVRIDD